MNLLFLGLLALVLAVVLLTTIYLVQETTRVTQTSETNWQMNLYLRGVEFLDSSGTSVAEKLCDDESRAKPTINDPISLPHGMTFETMLAVDLIIDNVFRTHQDLIYPVGLSTTWDRSIFTVYDGLDVQRYRSKLGSKFQRTLLKTVTLTLPEKTGLQYIIIMSGAMMNTQQLFYATEDQRENAFSVWNLSYDSFPRSLCGGLLSNTFSHRDGHLERATFPVVAIPINVT
jgi:hypothetical protein